ncbi:MAG TPA: tol-pal system protein YbgF [Gammaproteobacteria bacterium]
MTALLRTTTLAGLAATAACSTMTPADDPLALKVTDLEARLIRMERVLQNESLIQLSTSIDQLRSDVQQLRGEVETLRFETENGAERQRDLYVDLDSRLQALEQAQARTGFAPAPGQGAFSASGAPAAQAGTDQQAYQAAFELIQSRRYQEAARAFESFLASYPQSPLTDNAQYWLAETYYVQRDFAGALPQFQKVIDNYPRSAKLPDALLKVGYCNAELNNLEAARAALERVMREFPETTAARLAAQRLERLSQG